MSRHICSRYPSIEDTTKTVLLSAHYDSRGSLGSVRAPGGNDDGSGTVGLLAIARTIKRLGIKFRSNVELVVFAGEEQGLIGSGHYARMSFVLQVFRISTDIIYSTEEMRNADRDLTLMVQADMIAYHEPGEPQQLGLPKTYVSPSCVARVPRHSKQL